MTAQARRVAQQRQQVQQAMVAVVRRVPVEAVAGPRRGLPSAVQRALRQRQALHAQELLAETEPGRALLRWRQERAQLSDTLALALAPRAVRRLWQQVQAGGGVDLTPLQRRVLDSPDPGRAADAPAPPEP